MIKLEKTVMSTGNTVKWCMVWPYVEHRSRAGDLSTYCMNPTLYKSSSSNRSHEMEVLRAIYNQQLFLDNDTMVTITLLLWRSYILLVKINRLLGRVVVVVVARYLPRQKTNYGSNRCYSHKPLQHWPHLFQLQLLLVVAGIMKWKSSDWF